MDVDLPTASDLMSRDVVTVAPTTPVGEIARLLREHGLNGVPVVEGERVVGVVTDTDLIARHARVHFPLYIGLLESVIPVARERHFEEELRRVLGTTAADIMSKPAVSVEESARLDEIATLMVERRARLLPVLRAGRLVGIISPADMIRLIERETSETAGGAA